MAGGVRRGGSDSRQSGEHGDAEPALCFPCGPQASCGCAVPTPQITGQVQCSEDLSFQNPRVL